MNCLARFLTFLASLLPAGCFFTTQLPSVDAPLPPPEPSGFPHEVFDQLLSAHVNDRGQVDYAAIRADRSELLRYLDLVSRFSPRAQPDLFTTEAEALAYWINAYNAFVIYAVVSKPELRSVNDDKTSFFYFTKYRLGGEAHSLYALENDIVRRDFSEPRIHFALNCASASCPELPAEAFVPERLEAQLSREAKEFCASDGNVRVQDGVILLSEIFDWYGEDFAAAGGPVPFCRAHGRDDLPEGAELRFIPYDWSLNAQPS